MQSEQGFSEQTTSDNSQKMRLENVSVQENKQENEENETNFIGTWRDGEYTGRAMGMNADIEVMVTVEDGVIADIEIVSQKDDPEYFNDALVVIEWMVEANTTDVDTVSGATYSSGGIIDAVSEALKGAGN